ncbi:GroES-like protein [Coniochaeta sp. PMI_546]|nr:GroES-like protein [Coniochaeta sp. PMI_546]
MASTLAITFAEPSSDPSNVIRFHYDATDTVKPGPGQVLVSYVVSPINPQDNLVIAGRYPVKPLHTHNGEPVPGYDGVARVLAVGPSTDGVLQPGDLVIPRRHGLGTWRSRAVLESKDVIRLGPTTDPVAASLFRMAFLPAYLLVEDMRSLKPGDWIIQNAASGTIAQLVVQFAHLKGCRVASVVRDRAAAQMSTLQTGADVVITESDLKAKGADAHPNLAEAVARGRVVLALDAVFGESGEQIANLLAKGGTYVNYGSLGGANGVIRLTQKLIFWNEIAFRNFRLTAQLGLRSPAEIETLLGWFEELVANKQVVVPVVEKISVPRPGEGVDVVSHFEELVRKALRPGVTVGARKQVLDFGDGREYLKDKDAKQD